MAFSKLIYFILTFVIVIISYAFYRPGTDIFHNINEKLKDYVGLNLEWFSASKGGDTKKLNSIISEPLFTDSDLTQFTGKNSGKIYLSILGKVFDVTKGAKYYGIGESYHVFAGSILKFLNMYFQNNNFMSYNFI